jgi:RNA polymerase sigma factor (sigma-70 family)
MPHDLPGELAALFTSSDVGDPEDAWAAFLGTYSRLLLHVARSLGPEYDAAMDRYAYILERLREADYRRLRAYVPDGRTKFTTWLTVVSRRLCLDHYRQRYGRNPDEAGRLIRRDLADSVAHAVDPTLVEDTSRPTPDVELQTTQDRQYLGSALDSLEPADRLLIRLRFEDGLSASEVSRIVGLPTPFHVYRRLNTLFALLRQQLRQAGFEEPET